MRKAILTRLETGDQGTFGTLDGWETPFKCATLELPWRDNARGKSCIPPGVYLFRWRTDSPKHGACYEEWDDPATPAREDVKDRDNIQIHSANLAGDDTKGFVRQLEGCIALGYGAAIFPGGRAPAGKLDQKGVTLSKDAVAGLAAAMNREVFELEIRWASETGMKS